MKKNVVMLIVVLVSLFITSTVKAQVSPIFPYSNPTDAQIKGLAEENSPKGKAFLAYMVKVVNRYLEEGGKALRIQPDSVGLQFIMAHLQSEESYLFDFVNSGYDSLKQEIVPSKGNSYEGFTKRFQFEDIDRSLLKSNCANVVYDRTRMKNPCDIEAFSKLLLQIIEDKSKLNLYECSQMVAAEKQATDAQFAAIRAEIAGVKDEVKKQKDAYTAQEERHKLELEELSLRSKGKDQMLWGAVAGLVSVGSGILYETKVPKSREEETKHEVEYQYPEYSLKMTILPSTSSTGKSAKSGSLSFGPQYCEGGDDDKDHKDHGKPGDCEPKPDVYTIIYQMMITNTINMEVINEYITNNYVTVQEITQILQTINNYNITNIIDPKVYELVKEMKTGKITFVTKDKFTDYVYRSNREVYKYVGLATGALFLYLEYRGLTNIVKANHVRFYLKQQDMKSTMQQNATASLSNYNPLKNTQLAFTWTFGPKASYSN